MGSYKLDIPSGEWDSSPVLDEIFGIDGRYPKDLAGWAALIVPEQREQMRDYLQEHVVGGCNRFDKEYRIVRGSAGAQRWVHGLVELELDEKGTPVRMIGTVLDVTDSEAGRTRERGRSRRPSDGRISWKPFGRLAGASRTSSTTCWLSSSGTRT
jgi:PAS domain S-box-containing protein